MASPSFSFTLSVSLRRVYVIAYLGEMDRFSADIIEKHGLCVTNLLILT